MGNVVLTEGDGEGAKRVGFDDVHPHPEERVMEIGNHVRAGDHQDVCTTFQ